MESENNWENISEDINEVAKKIKDKLGEEDLVEDLKDSIKQTIDNTSEVLNNLLETIDSTIKDEEIRQDAKKVIDFANSDYLNNPTRRTNETFIKFPFSGSTPILAGVN